MILLGKMQTLRVIKKADPGVYLASLDTAEEGTAAPEDKQMQLHVPSILLPKRQAEGLEIGNEPEVFVYKDSEDRPIATTARPSLVMGEIKKLVVKEVNNIGAFLDWGLAKDLFLPFKEQTYPVKNGDSVLVTLYIDKSSRLCATMKLYPYLPSNSPYQREDRVSGTVYEIIDSFGAYVAVDDQFSALIPKHQLFTKLAAGETVSAHVTKVQPDGRLELSIRERSYLLLGTDGEKIYEMLCQAGGFLPYHDKTSPELIQAKFGLSKSAFKRAIGHLQKNGKIIIEEDGIAKAE